MLLDFSSISVRDQNSKDIVSEKFPNMPVDIVLDPTFLIDHNVPKPNLDGKYIFITILAIIKI
ncbi:polysaccharide pyruvyl transferase family protein [Campylobacter concisus]|uniref:Polysaccharide pyruvyl transferase family protein n=1 Tax=Campylobacter concisus TaxID=199 RepID=A0A7S9WQX7_9BACT|nr:polysaccharide pyruvyl transferase family protein [Campylobacter concisus]